MYIIHSSKLFICVQILVFEYFCEQVHVQHPSLYTYVYTKIDRLLIFHVRTVLINKLNRKLRNADKNEHYLHVKSCE